MITPVLVFLGTVTGGLLTAELTENRRAKYIFKPIASLSFLGLALFCGALSSAYGLLILAGLCFCALGDVLLLPDGAGKWFRRGVMAFFAGHVFYIFAFISLWQPEILSSDKILAVPLALFLLFQAYKRMRGPGADLLIEAYIAVIALMLGTALYAGYASGLWLAAGAAALFAISDVFVGRNRSEKSDLRQFWIITPLYFTAQALFALSISQA